jgi:broad specificity phosphatase PhoE
VRHAEKAGDDPRDPSLSEAGAARAQALARWLADAPLRAVYATGYRRTQQTARPSADAHGLAVTPYDASLPAGAFAARLRTTHRRGTVLVVGHSNTAPALAAALCGCATTPLGDGDYGRVYRIRVDADGHARLDEALSPPAPQPSDAAGELSSPWPRAMVGAEARTRRAPRGEMQCEKSLTPCPGC